MRLLLVATCPKTRGLSHYIDLIDLHTANLNAANQVMVVVGGEAANVDIVVVGILPTVEIMKTTGPTMTQGVAITLTVRVTLLAMGEI